MATWLARILWALILLTAGAVSGIAGWAQYFASVEPERVLEIYAGEAKARLAIAEKARLEQRLSPAQIADQGAALTRRAPLLDAPLVYAGLNLAEKGDTAAARGAFAMAVRRQPRNVPALSWLAADAVRDRRLEAAADYLDRLAVLNPASLTLYSEVLASLTEDSQGIEILESRLASGSQLAVTTLNRLVATSEDLSMLLRLTAQSPETQARFVERLLAEKGALPAFVAWVSLTPVGETQLLSWPFDPVFVGSAAPPPFNWEVFDGAELLKQGGLHLSYSGSSSPLFAQQLMLVSPGRYAFRTEMDGEVSELGRKFQWSLECYPGRQELGSVTVVGLASTLSEHGFDFTVPSDEACAAQRLKLRGLPGEFPARARGTVRRVTIESAGASIRAAK